MTHGTYYHSPPPSPHESVRGFMDLGSLDVLWEYGSVHSGIERINGSIWKRDRERARFSGQSAFTLRDKPHTGDLRGGTAEEYRPSGVVSILIAGTVMTCVSRPS